MPQMFPMNWILMFLIFIMIFLISMNKIFYIPNITYTNNSKQMFSSYLNNWKW